MSRKQKARCMGMAALVAVFFAGLYVSEKRTPASTAAQTVRWQSLGRLVELSDETRRARVRDPVFLEQSGDGNWLEVGFVESVRTRDSDDPVVQLRVFMSDLNPERLKWNLYESDRSLRGVLETLLPLRKRDELNHRIRGLLETHGQAMSAALVPLLRQSLIESLPLIEDALVSSLRARRAEWEQLGVRLESDVLKRRMIPLIKQEILPVLKKHAGPIIEDIGEELWSRASLWRFGWRAVYDKSPLPERGLLQEEWQRFVQDEATPVIEERIDDITSAASRAISDVIANRRVRSEMREVVAELIDDQQTRRLVKSTLRDALVENEQLRVRWNQIWTSADAKRAIKDVGDRIEPAIRQIGDEVLGTPDEGIDPNFARVLRSQILGKDRRWLVAFGSDSSDHVVRLATKSMPYPVVYVAGETNEN